LFKTLQRTVNQFIHSQSLGGVILALAAAVALVVSNSPWSGIYERFINLPGELRIGGDALVLAKPLLIWVNDLWMAVFFFLVGLEIKRELLEGELASRSQALLPAGAAVGGMLVPALVYTAINWGDAVALRGWAIPAATDIAFALGILVLLGSRVPASLKIFLTAVAIIDDLGAILIIAFFYTANLSPMMLLAAGIGALVLWVMNRMRIMAIGPYVVVGLVIWLCVLKSGIHATLAGVVTALAIPLADGKPAVKGLLVGLDPAVTWRSMSAGLFSPSRMRRFCALTSPPAVASPQTAWRPPGSSAQRPCWPRCAGCSPQAVVLAVGSLVSELGLLAGQR
jgi:NhaA family Na+:H+ antiporter